MKLFSWKIPTPEERQRNVAKMRWWFTGGLVAVFLTLAIGFGYLYGLFHRYHLSWTELLHSHLQELGVMLAGILLMCLELGWFAYSSWRAWHQVCEEDRLKKLRESQLVPAPGVWPPPPRVVK